MAQARGRGSAEDDVSRIAFAHEPPPRPHGCAGADPRTHHRKRRRVDRAARGDRAALDAGGADGGVICGGLRHTEGVMPRAGGASSTPRRLGSITTVSAILDRPPSRAMTVRVWWQLSL